MKIRIRTDVNYPQFWIETKGWFFWMPLFESHSSQLKLFRTKDEAMEYVKENLLRSPIRTVAEIVA